MCALGDQKINGEQDTTASSWLKEENEEKRENLAYIWYLCLFFSRNGLMCWQEASGCCQRYEHLCSFAENWVLKWLVEIVSLPLTLSPPEGSEASTAQSVALNRRMWLLARYVVEAIFQPWSLRPSFKCSHSGQISFAFLVGNKKERCQVSKVIVTQACKESHQEVW